MFTGIVEKIGRVAKISLQGKNRHFFIESELAPELKIDQSVAHNGVCLTVVGIQGKVYEVVAIDETLQKTSLGTWQVGDSVNLERAMKLGDRLDQRKCKRSTCELLQSGFYPYLWYQLCQRWRGTCRQFLQ